jgi:hypothetical protein
MGLITADMKTARDEGAEILAGTEADRNLRERFNSLLQSDPPTPKEWTDADLLAMSGADATDEELIAYWQTHRTAVELEALEIPHLSYVKEHLDAGRDPAEEFRREQELEELEEQEEGD